MRRFTVIALSFCLFLAAAPSSFAAKKGKAPHQSRVQKSRAKKNKAQSRRMAKRANTARRSTN